MAGRRCPGQHCPRILTNGERYCPTHEAEYEAKRGTPVQRGYDAAHRRLKASWQARIDHGEIVHCWRCGAVINPTRWHLGHDDDDRSKHRGPECQVCNTRAGGREGRARQTLT